MQKGRVKPDVIPSSGNVFADLGVTNAEEKQTKVRLAVAINQIIQGRKLSQMAAARRLNVNQPKVSALSNYQLDGFSVERLMNFLTALDRDVDIIIRRAPRSRKGGRILVTAASMALYFSAKAKALAFRIESGPDRPTIHDRLSDSSTETRNPRRLRF